MKMYFEHSLLSIVENETSWRFYVKNPYKILHQLGKVPDNDILIVDWYDDIDAEILLMTKILKKTYDWSFM